MDGAAQAHRLALTGPEWTVLCDLAGVRPPAGFGPEEEVPEAARAAADLALAERDVLHAAGDDRTVHPSVRGNLALWADPDAVVRLEITVRQQGLRASYAIRGQAAGSLVTLPDDGVEMSLFPATELGDELVRAVPKAPERVTEGSRIGAALAGAAPDRSAGADPGPDTGSAVLRGRLPLAALADYAAVSQLAPDSVATQLSLSPAEAALAADVAAHTLGVLRALVVSGDRASRAAGAVLAGQVIWLATDHGWCGLRPRPDGSGRQLVELVPVGHTALGGWLAPYLTRILEVVGD